MGDWRETGGDIVAGLISCVVPCYNEQDNIHLFLNELADVADQMRARHPGLSFEAVFVDDGSTDSTLSLVKEAARTAGHIAIRWVSFSRNFGKEAALYAGLAAARGEYIATMDADLQDPPSLLPQMYERLLEGDFDNVATRRATRAGEPPVRSFFARRFYRLINRLSDTEIVDGARDFRLMRRRMVDAILSVTEVNRFSKGIFSWVGFKTDWIEYDNVERVAGSSKWSFWSLMRYAFGGIMGYSVAPLSAVAVAGGFFCLVALVMLVFIIVRALAFGDPVAGWPSTMCAILLIGGLQMLFLGVIGQYLAQTYLEAKRRPLYIVRESSDSAHSVPRARI